MSVNRPKRQKADRAKTSKECNYHFQHMEDFKYEEDYYLRFNSNYRKYRSWKHNRKTQYKTNGL